MVLERPERDPSDRPPGWQPGPDDPHYAALVECRMCGYRWAAVWPAGTEEEGEGLECPRCTATQSRVVADIPAEE